MKYLMGIDIGTSGTKTALFDIRGQLIASHTAEYRLYQPMNGYAEQDAEDWWKAVVEGIKAVLEKSGCERSGIASIGLSGQMHGLVMLDENGEPLRRSIIWCDQRTAAECDEITALVGEKRLIEITANPALTGFTASKIMWVKKNEPDIYAKCRHILLPKDYIRYKLSGTFAAEVSDASGMQLLDIKNRCWSDEVLQKLAIDRELLAPVYESPDISAYISAEAAALTGLKEGTPIAGGAGDNAAAAVGCGVVEDGKAFTTIGTSGVVFAHTDNILIDMRGRIHTFCCAVPGKWHVMGVTQGAGLSLKWFKDNFCSLEIVEGEKLNKNPYFLLDKEAAKIPVGSNNLIYLPYLMGERTPHLDPDARAVFFGLSAMHTRYDMARAIMEGVTFSLRDCLAVLREYSISADDMVICGGGANSPFWMQMISDNFACPVKTTASSEGAALGAALLAAVGAGIYSSVPSACSAAIEYGSIKTPDENTSKVYEKYYSIYRDLYPALKESFNRLKQE